MSCGVLDDANLEALLIMSLVLFANVVIIITVIICISVVYRRSKGEDFNSVDVEFIASCYRPSMAWSVGLSDTVVSRAKTAEPIEMPSGLRTQVGPRNHV